MTEQTNSSSPRGTPEPRAASFAVSVVLHGYAWPDAAAVARLHARVRDVWPDAEILEAREEAAGSAIGAAAAINHAAAGARGGWLVLIEASLLPDAADLAAFAHPAGDGITIDAAGSVEDARAGESAASGAHAAGDAGAAASSSTVAADLLEELARLRETLTTTAGGGDDAAATHDGVAAAREGADDGTGRTPIVSVPRAQWDSLGGLDERLWSVGFAEDLAARARLAGVPVRRKPIRVESVGLPAWPLPPIVTRLLRTRNRAITALKTAAPEALGAVFAREATRALLESWRSTGLTEETFRFGGSWGRRTASGLAALAGRGGRAADAAPLRDPLGVLVPLLALDAALEQCAPLAAERAHWARIAREHARPAAAQAPGHTPDHTLRHDPADDPARDPSGPRDDAPPAHAPHVVHAHAASVAAAGAATDARDSRLRGADSDAGSRGASTPFVSVIIVNWNGREHLQDCFGSLSRSDYPADRLELICVDNGSTDDSVAFLRAQFPAVRIVSLETNRGFTGGNEAGVAAARGDVLVFFNNDMRVEPDCLRELTALLDSGTGGGGTNGAGGRTDGGGEIACVGARVLSWDGRRIDFIRGSVNFEARGFQDHYAARNTPDLATPADTFFPNGGAFAVTRAAYDRAGGFDPAFFAYYDDVDLGWRLRIAGVEPRVAGRAVAYHRHGATARTQPQGQKRFLMERNAVWTMMKNYGEPALRRAFGPALALHARRLLDETAIDRRAPALRALTPFVGRLRRPRDPIGLPASAIYDTAADGASASAASRGPRASRAVAPPHLASAGLFKNLPIESLAGAGAALDALQRARRDRARVQATRRVADDAILPRFGRAFDPISPFGSYIRIQHALMHALDLPAAFRSRTRLLIISPEPVARNMSGPSARVLEIGRALAATCRVTIATPGAVEFEDPRLTIAAFSRAKTDGLRRLAEDADVILIQGFALALYPFLKPMGVPIIADLYCPFTIEYLEMKRSEMLESAHAGDDAGLAIQTEAAGVFGMQNEQLRECDFFICASERQRDFWIGALHSQGRLNPLTYTDDATLRRLIDVVPFGLSDEAAEEAARRAGEAAGNPGPVMRGVWPGIGPDDRILLWAGSMLDWQDPLAVIEAVGLLARTHPDVRLVFMGTRHPNPDVPPMRMVKEGRALAERLGLLDRHVFFNDWVPYDQRARFLLESDLGLSTHTDHLETHFSFRTRMLDYVWGGLPIVCTRGDFFADLVHARGLGRVVPPNDVPALAAAIAHLLDDPQAHATARAQLAALRGELTWTRVVAPIVAFCADPRQAADRVPGMAAYRARLEEQFRGSRWIRRTALGLGLSERNLERIKRSRVVQAAMSARNQMAIRRARRG